MPASACERACLTKASTVLSLIIFPFSTKPSCPLILYGSTINAAFAIGKIDRGSIAADWRADLLICDIPDYRHLTYHFGINHVETVIIGGKIIDDKVI